VEYVIGVILLLALAWFVTMPLRRSADAQASEADEDPVLADLEARKEALYRQIRDAELDREQGKLSQADWSRQDAELRRDAIQILKELDRAQAEAKDERGAGSRQRT
jgi:hypothetical protein